MDPAIDQLCDYVEWTAAALSLQASTVTESEATELLARMAAVRARIDAAETSGTPASLARLRLGLSPTECEVVWLLAAIAVDANVRALMQSHGTSGGVRVAMSITSFVEASLDRRSRPVGAELATKARFLHASITRTTAVAGRVDEMAKSMRLI